MSEARTEDLPPFRDIEPDEWPLSNEQLRVLDMVKSGQNVFFTGPAGTGKSVLLRRIIKILRSDKRGELAVTAPTGIAALNVGGSTVHSFAGIGLGKESAEDLVRKIKRSGLSKQRWRDTRVLIVDEISMLDGGLFDKLEYIARVVRESDAPFGSIQLILSGDFFQLPPVPDHSFDEKRAATYAFDAKSWSSCISRPIFLHRVFRQSDEIFIGILANIRHGILTDEDTRRLRSLSRPLHYPDGIEPSQLFPLRREVEVCNNSRLEALTGPKQIYQAMHGAGFDVYGMPIPTRSAEALLERLVAPPVISIKIGAQVILIQNIESGWLVNGSVGKVIEFLTIREALLQDPPRGVPDVTFSSSAFSFEADDEVRPINAQIFSRHQKWPLVRFDNQRELLCVPAKFSVEGCKGNIEARRLQVPLILAWALSIHRSQGQTLSRVKVDLRHVFENGQAYVAISRARSMEGLEIQNFEPSKVFSHPRVVRWHEFWTSYGDGDLPDDMYSDDISGEVMNC